MQATTCNWWIVPHNEEMQRQILTLRSLITSNNKSWRASVGHLTYARDGDRFSLMTLFPDEAMYGQFDFDWTQQLARELLNTTYPPPNPNSNSNSNSTYS